MRKLLLASAAMLGATVGGAFAQAPAAHPNQGQYAAPWAAGPSANNNNNSIGIAGPGVTAVPTPGTVVIRLNGRVQTEMGVGWTSNDKTTTLVGGVPTRFEVNPIRFTSYMRLYPGFDGLTTNGLRYGGTVELRENFGPTTGLSPSGYSSTETVFVRRAFAYMGTDQVGIVRIGQTDGVIGLFDGGVFTTQTWDGGVGNFNGGQSQAWGISSATGVPWVFLSQAGAEYSNSKIVYLSPQFFGFDFGVQYAPSMYNSYTSCAAPSQACAQTITGNDTTRWYNQVAVGARYQGKFAGLGVKAMVVYETAARKAPASPAVPWLRRLAEPSPTSGMTT
jgi:porin-like protein